MKAYSALALPAVLLAAWAADPGVPAASRAGESGIEVTGVGEASAKPDAVVIRTYLLVSADAAGDALTKYRDSRRRAIKMIEDLGVEGLTVSGSGPVVSVNPGSGERAVRVMIDGGNADPEPKAVVSETLVARISNVATLDAAANAVVKVLDKAKEAGLKTSILESMMNHDVFFFGYQPPATRRDAPDAVGYVVTDPARLEEAAWAKAMEDGRRRAEMLAKLAGRKLGPAKAIVQEEAPGEKSSFDGVVRARLRITFAME
jgi:uncharacterized protein YggE